MVWVEPPPPGMVVTELLVEAHGEPSLINQSPLTAETYAGIGRVVPLSPRECFAGVLQTALRAPCQTGSQLVRLDSVVGASDALDDVASRVALGPATNALPLPPRESGQGQVLTAPFTIVMVIAELLKEPHCKTSKVDEACAHPAPGRGVGGRRVRLHSDRVRPVSLSVRPTYKGVRYLCPLRGVR